MTLARTILDAMSSLFAYAMAPDDFSHAERLEVIRKGREGMEAADALARREGLPEIEETPSTANQPTSQPDPK
jgi:hypothetical protein